MSNQMIKALRQINEENRVQQTIEVPRQSLAVATSLSVAFSFYMNLPGLVGFWPGKVGLGAAQPTGLYDAGSNSIHMSRIGAGYESADSTGLSRWITLDGDEYWAVADDAYNSILGTENAVDSAIRGLTVMAWVKPTDATPAASEGIIGKYNGGTSNRSWLMFRTTGLPVQFLISSNGSTNAATVNTTNDFDADEWRFVAARYTPSTQIRVWEGFTYGLVTNENTTSIPASLFDSNDNLAIGAFNTLTTPAGFYQGHISLIALCHAALPDNFIETAFELTKIAFL